jgi:hypothetical protein
MKTIPNNIAIHCPTQELDTKVRELLDKMGLFQHPNIPDQSWDANGETTCLARTYSNYYEARNIKYNAYLSRTIIPAEQFLAEYGGHTLETLKKILDDGGVIANGIRVISKEDDSYFYSASDEDVKATRNFEYIAERYISDPSEWSEVKTEPLTQKDVVKMFFTPDNLSEPSMMVVPVEQWKAMEKKAANFDHYKAALKAIDANDDGAFGEAIKAMAPDQTIDPPVEQGASFDEPLPESSGVSEVAGKFRAENNQIEADLDAVNRGNVLICDGVAISRTTDGYYHRAHGRDVVSMKYEVVARAWIAENPGRWKIARHMDEPLPIFVPPNDDRFNMANHVETDWKAIVDSGKTIVDERMNEIKKMGEGQYALYFNFHGSAAKGEWGFIWAFAAKSGWHIKEEKPYSFTQTPLAVVMAGVKNGEVWKCDKYVSDGANEVGVIFKHNFGTTMVPWSLMEGFLNEYKPWERQDKVAS